MRKFFAVAVLVLSAVALSACGDERYSIEVGAVATQAPPPTVAPVPTPVVIVVNQPAPAPAVAPTPADGLTFFLLGVSAAGILVITACAIALVNRRAAPRLEPSAPYPPYHEAFTPQAPETLLHVTNHYHYHAAPEASAPPVGPRELNIPEEWTIQKKAEHLLGMGYTVTEARAYLEDEHRRRAQLPPPKGSR